MYSTKAEPWRLQRVTRAPLHRFAIVGNPRTGSSYLGSLLDSHPDIACWDDEIFNYDDAFDHSGYDRVQDFLTGRIFVVDAKVVGFKLLWDALDRIPDMWGILHELDISLLHVTRSNLLDSFISYQLATINDAFTSWYGDYIWKEFEADYDELVEWLENSRVRDQEIRRHAEAARLRRLEIEYAELCRGPAKALDFLGVQQLTLQSELKKQREASQPESISNYWELKARFLDTPYEDLFTD